ncbi:hypothetical protein DVR12_12825 [Chitinophaga silvatica]|uniref:Uncharacterized protein n=1 Tax=Chitinophaga silvatica TaxID=2282649 RepID=A0A3E1YAA4_9BACT|nr:hypothetical protein [Chitinophaga silvatica]RFS22674.1 hypothetical protein DVR12_12825 [Chitinophaga silvatica]
MHTNNFFQPTRMLLYFKKYATDNLKFYILGALATFGIMTGIGAFGVLVAHTTYTSTTNIIPFYYIGLYLGSALLTSRSFNEFSSKEKSIDFLMLPASQFEKFLTTFLITVVGYFIFYHISCFLSLNIIEGLQNMKYNNQVKLVHDYEFLSNYREYWYYGYFLLQAIILLAATWFHKYTLIKTIVSLFVVLLAVALVHSFIILCLFGTEGEMYKRTAPFFLVGKQIYNLSNNSSYTEIYIIPEWLRNTYLFIVKFIVGPALLVLTYFRLKDKEI